MEEEDTRAQRQQKKYTLNVWSNDFIISCCVELMIHTSTQCHAVWAHHRRGTMCVQKQPYYSQAVDVKNTGKQSALNKIITPKWYMI